MSIAIRYWKISIFEDRNAEAVLIGYQSTPEIEVVDGHALVKDETQLTTRGFPLKDAAGFKIEPVYFEDGVKIERTVGKDGTHFH
ncbi:MAG: hypothetical protein GXW94_03435 [Serratia liquefaciens]|nr:hypothetical protein [Serratia liquefaciens]